jgi:hypothetical protein
MTPGTAVADTEPAAAEERRQLAEHAYHVLMGWARSGQLCRKARAALDGRGVRGIGRVPVDIDASREEVELVAIDMLVLALDSFWPRHRERWDPDGRASLQTYFVTYCLMQMPRAYDKVYRRELRPVMIIAADGLDADLPDTDLGPEAIAELRERVAQLARGDRRLQRMLLLRLHGCTQREIASTLSNEGSLTTEGQVRGALRRLARSAREPEETAE